MKDDDGEICAAGGAKDRLAKRKKTQEGEGVIKSNRLILRLHYIVSLSLSLGER
jgi:hypothetical protein